MARKRIKSSATSRRKALLVSSTTMVVRKNPEVLNRITQYTPDMDKDRKVDDNTSRHDTIWDRIRTEARLLAH